MKQVIFLITLIFIMNSCYRETKPPAPLLPLPSQSQLAWHDMEMNAFVHFTTNTFSGKEWGYGDEDPNIFNPTAMDAEQWIRTFKETGFKGVILTCKHHDGFCIWPSKFTDHSVKSSQWKDGKGDVVRDVAEACKKYGLKFGIYVSPWDRNHKAYGTPEYIEYYRNQIKELFTNYGPIFEMWFDGANGGDGFYGGAKEKRSIDGSKYYDWPATLNEIRTLEPAIIFFSDAGPGVRWVGNEKGIAGETNWNTISTDTLFAGKAGIESLLNTGSENGTSWVPAEVDVSIRPGWFYHAEEDALVKSPERLFDIYLTSVGRGSTLLLNIPPDRRGLIHENDVAALKGFKALRDSAFKNNLALSAILEVSTTRGDANEFSSAQLNDRDPETFWSTDDDVVSGSVEIQMDEGKVIHYVVLQEYIPLGQRVRSFTIEAWVWNKWKPISEGTTIGYKRIVQLPPTATQKIRITFQDAKACLAISNIEIY
ncbi:MAG: alpha-L-fucosidase [Cyclobacteriaceae bacterium]|nr:alpha-L-fucosidase [Cyclobacteriaceae bacterium]